MAHSQLSLAEPRAGRPQMPEGYGVPQDDVGLMPWSKARAALEQARLYWVSTTRPDGRPHAVPIWGAWLEDTFYFEGSPQTRRGRNLAVNPAVVVHIERGDLAVMVEGVAEVLHALDPTLFARIADSFAARYAYRPEHGEGMYAVHAKVVLAWDEFPASATRWSF
jgi:nitroimidazol reductase NimA-like FMN-containing flavoprotein (pyridoxamine 5'-phosphate oxidase superfamily)